MKTIEYDVASEGEEFLEWLEELSKRFENAWVRIVTLSGPAAGWPVIEVMIDEEREQEFEDWFGGEIE